MQDEAAWLERIRVLKMQDRLLITSFVDVKSCNFIMK
jgi:hypothetical protein